MTLKCLMTNNIRKFNKDLNKYYGTENVKYEPYGRAGKGTVNLTFKEHFDNLGHQYKANYEFSHCFKISCSSR